MLKNILISVSDKTHLDSFVKAISNSKTQIWSTGGTFKYLQKSGVSVREVSELTKFPEVFGGRVKTLHPRVHMGLLQRAWSEEDQLVLKQEGLEAFDALIVNLYPFESSFLENLEDQELIEEIDIGGPAMVRAASKNINSVMVVTDPKDYEWIAAHIQKEGQSTLDMRRALAAKAFAHVSAYDALVSQYLFKGVFSQLEIKKDISFGSDIVSVLRYGENPHQKALWLKQKGASHGLHAATFIQGKELSYNNVLDLDAARATVQKILNRFPNKKITCVVKHNNPCGVGLAESSQDSVERALKADPISAFGGIVVTNFPINKKEAQLFESLFLECILAPKFESEALEIFSKKKNLRILEWLDVFTKSNLIEDIDLRSIQGGFLLQSSAQLSPNASKWVFHGQSPDAETLETLLFAESVCAQLKSNSIAICCSGMSIGLGMGQVNRVDAVEQALQRARQHHPLRLSQAVLASDAFFPFPDSIEKLAHTGIRWVLQPGGALRDQDVIQKARELEINLVFTGERQFKH